MNSKDWHQSSTLLLNEFVVWLKKSKASESTANSDKKPPAKKEKARHAA